MLSIPGQNGFAFGAQIPTVQPPGVYQTNPTENLLPPAFPGQEMQPPTTVSPYDTTSYDYAFQGPSQYHNFLHHPGPALPTSCTMDPTAQGAQDFPAAYAPMMSGQAAVSGLFADPSAPPYYPGSADQPGWVQDLRHMSAGDESVYSTGSSDGQLSVETRFDGAANQGYFGAPVPMPEAGMTTYLDGQTYAVPQSMDAYQQLNQGYIGQQLPCYSTVESPYSTQQGDQLYASNQAAEYIYAELPAPENQNLPLPVYNERNDFGPENEAYLAWQGPNSQVPVSETDAFIWPPQIPYDSASSPYTPAVWDSQIGSDFPMLHGAGASFDPNSDSAVFGSYQGEFEAYDACAAEKKPVFGIPGVSGLPPGSANPVAMQLERRFQRMKKKLKEKAQLETVEEIAKGSETGSAPAIDPENPEDRQIQNCKEPVDSNFAYCRIVMDRYRRRRAILKRDGISISRCNLCLSFSTANTPRGLTEFMKLHLFSHVKKNPFFCGICGKSETTNPSKVRAHIKKYHPTHESRTKKALMDRRPEYDDKLCLLADECWSM